MGRRARVNRDPEQKLEIVLEGLESINIAETCRRYEIAPNLYCRGRTKRCKDPALGEEAPRRWETRRTGQFDS